MALEDLLKELIVEMKANTEVTKNLISLRTEAIEAVKTAAAPATKAAAAPKTEKAAETKAADPAPVTGTVDASVYESIAAAIGAYVGGATRDEERAARKEKVKKLLQHEAIKKPGTPADVFDAKNIKDDAIGTFNDNLAALVAKGDLTTPPAPASTTLDI